MKKIKPLTEKEINFVAFISKGKECPYFDRLCETARIGAVYIRLTKEFDQIVERIYPQDEKPND